MIGTSPVFFKIPVTKTLSAHIFQGTYLPEETKVIYCYPLAHLHSEGVKPLDNRRETLRHNEAFKSIVGI
jgi:hypothetical protein